MTRIRKSWMLGTALLLAMTLQLAVTPARAGGGGFQIDPPDDPPSGDSELVGFLPELPFDCVAPTAQVQTPGVWGITVLNSQTYRSHDAFCLTISQDGEPSTHCGFVDADPNVPTHVWVDPMVGLDGPPVLQFCHGYYMKIGESPDPVVTIKQNPPPM